MRSQPNLFEVGVVDLVFGIIVVDVNVVFIVVAVHNIFVLLDECSSHTPQDLFIC